MSYYTPTLDELRKDFTGEAFLPDDLVQKLSTEFDRAIAKIKADAILEVADEFERLATIGSTPSWKVTPEQRAAFWEFAAVEKASWMRKQAAKLDPS